jgi:hypothetical protein
MANKKPTITLGKGTGYTKETRPVSTKPSDASKLRATKKTSSSGITERPDGRAQSEGRGARQSTSTAKVTSGQGKQRVVLPELPPKPKPSYSGTTNTIRATGGNSRDPKINRLSAQASPITGNSPIARQPKPKPTAAANLAKSQQMLRNQVGPIASAVSGLKGLGMQAVADAVAPRPTANQDVAYNQKKAADVLKMKKKRTA